jgi:Domain of unknown function (DUF6484)
MKRAKAPLEITLNDEVADEFTRLTQKPAAISEPPAPATNASTALLHGFALDDRPLLTGVYGLPGEVVTAMTTVALRRDHIGSSVVCVFDQGDLRRPIVIGVLCQPGQAAATSAAEPRVTVVADDERLVLSAEREVTLRCGEASITLTRAGKVVISGTYVVSRSSGYNKIKGAAVDIN